MNPQFDTSFNEFSSKLGRWFNIFSAAESGNPDVEYKRMVLPDYIPGLKEALAKAYKGHRRILDVTITRRHGSEIQGYVMTWLKSEKAVFYDDFIAVLNKENKIKRVKVGGRKYVRII
jgi:hypothetical protein